MFACLKALKIYTDAQADLLQGGPGFQVLLQLCGMALLRPQLSLQRLAPALPFPQLCLHLSCAAGQLLMQSCYHFPLQLHSQLQQTH